MQELLSELTTFICHLLLEQIQSSFSQTFAQSEQSDQPSYTRSHMKALDGGQAPQCGHMDIYLALTNTAISNDLKLVFMMLHDANDHHHLYHNHYCHHIDDQEYERAVIFRLGRLLTGGARGPGHRQHRHRHQCHRPQ